MLIADIKRHSMSDTRAVVFHNSYATGTEKLQITKMTMPSYPAWHPSIAMLRASVTSSASVVSVSFADLVSQS